MESETELNQLTIKEVIFQKNKAKEEAYCGALLVGLTSLASIYIGSSLMDINAFNYLSFSFNILLTLANVSCLSGSILFTIKKLAKKADCQAIIDKYNDVETIIKNNLTAKRIDPCDSRKKPRGQIINASYRVVQEKEI